MPLLYIYSTINQYIESFNIEISVSNIYHIRIDVDVKVGLNRDFLKMIF